MRRRTLAQYKEWAEIRMDVKDNVVDLQEYRDTVDILEKMCKQALERAGEIEFVKLLLEAGYPKEFVTKEIKKLRKAKEEPNEG